MSGWRGVIDVALVGCGKMGGHHARTIAAAPGTRLVAVHDRHPERASQIAEHTGARVVQQLPLQVDAWVVATPTKAHLDFVEPALKHGLWCLVEKPVCLVSHHLSPLTGGLERLFVGHIERFNPAVRAAGDLAPQRMDVHRQSEPQRRGVDIDVILDLMIHDLDLLLWWTQERALPDVVKVSGQRNAGGLWDVAHAELRTSKGVHASFSASRLASRQQRTARVVESQRIVELDYLNRSVRIDGRDCAVAPGPDGLTAQWRGFTDAIRGEYTPIARGEEGLRALQLAERVLDALRSTS